MGKDIDEAKRKGGKFRDKVISITGNELERSLVKVTSHSTKPVSEKHMSRLLTAAQGDQGETRTTWMLGELEKRLHNHEWIVVVKSLYVLHTMIKRGSAAMTDTICHKQGIFHISHFKDMTEHSRFIKKYSRYLEERCIATVHMGCGLTIERTKELMAELERMPSSRALKATKCLSLQLGVLVGLELATPAAGLDWTNHTITVDALLLLVHDSRLLFTILTMRTKWLLDHVSELTEADRAQALETFLQYTDYSTKLVDMFEELRKHGTVSKVVPSLTPLPLDKVQLLTQYLKGEVEPIKASDTDFLGVNVEPLDSLYLSEQPLPEESSATIEPPAPATQHRDPTVVSPAVQQIPPPPQQQAQLSQQASTLIQFSPREQDAGAGAGANALFQAN